jgi:predicted DNA-binding transcriptional regulator AlpA
VPTRRRCTPAPSVERLIPFDEAAALIGVIPKTLHRWVAAGVFPAPMRLGRKGKVTLRYRKSDLEAFFQKEAAHAAE